MRLRPQDPEEPPPYTVEDVRLETEAGRVQLAGNFTCPQTSTRAPAILLIPGSGPQDRNEQLCGHRPFLVLADHLTRAGIAVLRLDDRGVGGSTGDKDQCTHENLLQDVRAALNHLAGHERVDAARLGLIGHSEGTVLAAAAAARHEDIAFVVFMAGVALPGAQTIHEQSALVSRLAGATNAQIAHERRMNEAVFEILMRPLPYGPARERILPILATCLATWPDRPDESRDVMADAGVMADVVLAPAFRSFLNCDPASHLREVRCPVLALFGELDVQAPPATHMPALMEALSMANNADVTAETWRGLNHLFQTATTGDISEYELIEETLAPALLERIATWVLSPHRRIRSSC